MGDALASAVVAEPPGTPVPPEHHSQPPDPLIGVEVGDGYQIGAKIAEGGMGALYVARHRKEPRKRFAIKVLLPSLLGRADIGHRFELEELIPLKINHPNVVSVIGGGRLPGGQVYIKMEFLDGKDLRRWATDRHDGKVPADDVLRILVQLCSALEHTHQLGVVHRDLKPENVFMVENDGGEIRTKLLDFGIARVVDTRAVPGKKTTIPLAMGTPGYWSPEQQTAPGTVDQRSDLYTVAIIALELLIGELPTVTTRSGFFPDTVPSEWRETLVAALSVDPTGRPQSARDFIAALIDRTADGATLAAEACPTVYRTAASAHDRTIKAPTTPVPGVRGTAPPALPPSTLAQAAGSHAAGPVRRGRLVLAALGGAALAVTVTLWVVRGSGSARSAAPLVAPTVDPTAAAPSASPSSLAPAVRQAPGAAATVPPAPTTPNPTAATASPPVVPADAPVIAPASPPGSTVTTSTTAPKANRVSRPAKPRAKPARLDRF